MLAVDPYTLNFFLEKVTGKRVFKFRSRKVHHHQLRNDFSNIQLEWNEASKSLLVWKAWNRDLPDTPHARQLLVTMYTFKPDV